ncbi:hypothetical protein AB0G83_25345 [Streptomyces klenkii]|uniref:hypothetical protein n=1 Tax=Streptomyces klenkii TaxID=1420899 RepID=UPI0033FE1761
MALAGDDGAAAAQGLRSAVGYYSAKADKLQVRHAELEAELSQVQDRLAAVQADLARASARRDQLTGALEEILKDVPPPGDTSTGRESSHREDTATGSQSSKRRRSRTKSGAGTSKGSGPESAKKKRTRPGELMRAILQILVTAGRPMSTKDITEALGRPITDSTCETTRSTCKRLLTAGQVVEDPVGVFAICHAKQAEEPPGEGAA